MEAMIGRHVYVVPKNGEAPFVGVLQQPLFNDDYYVRDRHNDLCGPYEEDELNVPLTAGTIVEHQNDTHIVFQNQYGDQVLLWRFDPQDLSRTYPLKVIPAKDVRHYEEEGMKNLEAMHPDAWMQVLRTEAAAIKSKLGGIW